jgi:hypothetical protein
LFSRKLGAQRERTRRKASFSVVAPQGFQGVFSKLRTRAKPQEEAIWSHHQFFTQATCPVREGARDAMSFQLE